MSTFTLNSITVQGLNIIAKLVAGSQLEFTRIAVGDGAMPSDKTPLTVTDLTHKLFDVDINSVVNNDNGSATVKGVFSNTASETGFFYRELGLFAKDPDTKKEILYCYGNAAADAEWISPAGSSSVIEKEVSIITLIGNAEKITVSLKSGIYTTKEDLDNLLDFRHQSTDYKVGDKVLCEYNCMLFLECTKAGTTDNNILNTRGFIHGQVVHDGTVEWTVRTNIKSINNLKADSNGNVAINDFLEKTGGTVTGDINASGYNITATKFIGKLQGKADSATNADLATKANQDSQGQVINTTYVKGVTASNATLTVTKGNGTTSTVTINNVENSKKATQDGSGNTITTHYLSRNQSTQNDMNACTVEGIYRFSGTLKNGWTSDSWGTLLVFNNQYNGSSGVSGTYLVQIALPTDGRMWTRQRVNTGAWTSWSKLANTTDCTDTLKKVYPVGSIYMSTVSTNPATLFGFGTWEAMPAGRVLLAQGKSSWGTTYNAGSTGGEATHQLTVGEIPSHNHTGSINTAGEHTHSLTLKALWGDGNGSGNGWAGDTRDGGSRTNTFSTVGNHTHTVTINSTGSGQPHNNLQPYISVYMWKRTV